MSILFDTAQYLGWKALMRRKLELAREAISDLENQLDNHREETSPEMEQTATVAHEALIDAKVCFSQMVAAENHLLQKQSPPPEAPLPVEDDLRKTILDIASPPPLAGTIARLEYDQAFGLPEKPF